MAQRHWTDLYSVLSRPDLDARKSGGEYAVAANPLASLAEIFNNYEDFQPQNVMVEYVTAQPGGRAVKKFPFAASAAEWSYLATLTKNWNPPIYPERILLEGRTG